MPEFCHSPCSPSSFGGPQPPAKVTDPLGTVMRKLAPCLTLLFLQLSQAAHVPFQACAVGTRFNCLARDGTWIDKDPTCRHARPIFGLTLPGKRGEKIGKRKKRCCDSILSHQFWWAWVKTQNISKPQPGYDPTMKQAGGFCPISKNPAKIEKFEKIARKPWWMLYIYSRGFP